MNRHIAMIVGVTALLMLVGLLEAMFGRVGAIIGVGVGAPAFLAFYYYVLDIEDRSRRQRGE